MNSTTTIPALAKRNPLLKLESLGQSVWLDFIRRSLIASGELQRLVDEDGVAGVTSNPAIFAKAITGSTDYHDALEDLRSQRLAPARIYERLAIEDIQDTADILRPVYERTRRRDGYVSLEVSPFLARDQRGTVAEGLRLWKEVGRENLMIKVPATDEGTAAVEELIAAGVNVNATLLFSRARYEKIAWAYIAGLEKLAAKGRDIRGVASVASFFVSRIDTAIDAELERRLSSVCTAAQRAEIERVMGRAAVANAKLAYQSFKEILRSDRWWALEEKGAQVQRLLWASTGAKNPNYSDVMYVESLIGPHTVDTMPPATLDAYRDHGRPRATLDEDMGEAIDVLRHLEFLGISIDDTAEKVLEDGVRLFAEPFQQILQAVAPKPAVLAGRDGRLEWRLPRELSGAARDAIEEWDEEEKVRRLWARDSSLWTGADEGDWMGWLGVVESQRDRLEELFAVQEKARHEGYTHALLLGMGGSSLAPEVLRKTFGRIEGYPELVILDSTDPAQVRAAEKAVDPERTLYIVSSKSGGTLEPTLFASYFLARAEAARGKDAAADFIAVTDPGSKLEDFARQEGFRRVFHGVKSIGGRYSALSDFGLIPAAVMGLDLPKLLDRAQEMVVATSSCVSAAQNPGVRLGLLLGTAAVRGRDKLTLIASPGLRDLGAWIEQLVAESTGKDGKGIIPIDREPLGEPEVYGNDRLFVYVRLVSEADPEQDAAVARLAEAGKPVVRIDAADRYDLAQEFFRWEIATAVAGSVLNVHPFNQPDVEAAKIATRRFTERYERTGTLPADRPLFSDRGLRIYSDWEPLMEAAQASPRLVAVLRAYLSALAAGDCLALQAFIEMTERNEEELTAMRLIIRDRTRIATTAGFGPRFLHSTGQAHKGGPAEIACLQLTCDDARDVPVPGQKYSFGLVKAAQASGDYEVLSRRKRRLLRIHLGADVPRGLETLRRAIAEALAEG